MLRRLLLPAAVGALIAAAPAAAAKKVPDPERSVNSPVQTRGNGFQYGTNAKSIMARVLKAGGRITTVDTGFLKGGQPFYAVGYVSNTGVQARPNWWWDVGVSEATLRKRIKERGARLIDLDVYEVDDKRFYSAVSIENKGAAAKSWLWLRRLKFSDIHKTVDAKGMRVVAFTQEENSKHSDTDGRIDVIAIRNSGVDKREWKLVNEFQDHELNALLKEGNFRVQDKEGFSLYVFVANERKTGELPGFLSTAPSLSLSQAAARFRAFGGRPVSLNLEGGPTGVPNFDDIASIELSATVVSDVPRATEETRAKVLFGDVPVERSDASETGRPFEKFGFLVRRAGAPPIASLNADQLHETASAMKALHHAAITHRYEQSNLPLDKAGDFRYQQFIGIPSCPDEPHPDKEFVDRTLSGAAIDLLRESDNGATAAFLQRAGGRDGLFAYAQTLGLKSVRLGGTLGCFSRVNTNMWTLNDATKLYAAMIGGLVAKQQPYVDHLRSSFLDDNEWAREAFKAAAVAARKPQPEAVVAGVDARAKGGGYDHNAVRIRTDAGYVILPVKAGEGVTRRPYYLGLFLDAEDQVPIGIESLRRELILLAIRDALTTFPVTATGPPTAPGSVPANSPPPVRPLRARSAVGA